MLIFNNLQKIKIRFTILLVYSLLIGTFFGLFIIEFFKLNLTFI